MGAKRDEGCHIAWWPGEGYRCLSGICSKSPLHHFRLHNTRSTHNLPFLFISLFLHGCIHKMLLHSYRFWQLLTLPICFGSLHRLLFVHLIVIPGEHSPAWFRLVHDAGKQVRYDRNQAAATFYVRCGSDLKLGYNWIKPLWPKGGITLHDIQSMCLCVERCVECSCMFINHDESIPDVSSQTVSCTHTIKGETGLYCNGFNLWIAFLNPV